MVSVTGVLRRFGPIGRRIAWNREFRRGAAFAGQRSELICGLVRRYGENRSVVELACGDGSLARSLSGVAFRSYQGFDVSDEAVRIANERAQPDQAFHVGQMQDWAPRGPFDLLVVEEAIYYLSPIELRQLLHRAFAAAPHAVVVVTVHSGAKHRASLDVCIAACDVVEEQTEAERVYLVLRRRSAPSPSA